MTVKSASRLTFGITQGVGSHIVPRLVRAVAPPGVVSMTNASVEPRVIVAQPATLRLAAASTSAIFFKILPPKGKETWPLWPL